jgi:D-alanyl-D-alanine carboxypeptidase/D-alanyl-D-alanine-endopeptidase (penicillin-binding protein 4)
VRLERDILALISGAGVSRGTWGISVVSLTRGEPLFEHNPRTLLVPASVSKLVAVAAAVDAVGWDYTFETRVSASGPIVNGVVQGDLVVTGSGDPSIGGRGGNDFSAWIDAFKNMGIRRIEGRIIGDDDAFEDPRPGAMWSWDDLGYTSGALFGALNFGENRMGVTVTPSTTPGQPATIALEPYARFRPVINRTVTGAPRSRALLWPEQRPGEAGLTIAGSLPPGSPPARLSVSVGNPTVWFAGILKRRLEDGDIAVAGDAVDIDDLPQPLDRSRLRAIYTYHSPPLAALAQPLLKESINIYAEAMLRLSTGPQGGRTNDDALEAIRNRLPLWGLPPDALQVVDGSGLSRRDAVAPDTLVTILRRMYDPSGTSPWMTGFPVAGRDGTLDGRLKGTAAENTIAAKTGTMSNIRSLAGYARTKDGEPLAFAIMVNNFEGTGAQAVASIDAIAVPLAELAR